MKGAETGPDQVVVPAVSMKRREEMPVPSKTVSAILAALVVVVAACGSSATSSPTTAPTQAATATAAASPTEAATATATPSETTAAGGCTEGATGSETVTIAGFAFSPADLTVAAGTTVTFTNQDQTPHTATADDGAFDCTPLPGGASLSFTFSTPGTIPYHCAIHSFMKGTITVT